jgi:hypothetical protein
MKIQLELDNEESWSLAEFIKRIGYEDVRRFSKDDEERRNIYSAMGKIRAELAGKGIDPR